MELSSFRILVVDDFAPFREFVCSTLAKRTELQVVGEAADGLEAVQKAVALKPDLIIIDIGLPSLNGLQAARKILELISESKIIFLSQESSAEVMQEAFDLGACDYVVKVRAVSKLLPAIDAVISGKRFVGSP